MGDAGNWCLIESDPGVFTELIQKFGVKGIQVEEIWSLDEDTFLEMRPVHGLIFLFKWQPDEEPAGSIVQDDRLEKIFFAKQTINNACATQAILSILLNTSHPEVDLGPTLTEFKEFTQNFDSNMKGLTLSNSDTIRNVHNAFARQTLFEFDDKTLPTNDEIYHFVGYLPFENRLYELDGLRQGPIDLGVIPAGSDWLKIVQPVIQQRIQRYSEGEIHFNLMAIVTDRRVIIRKKIAQLEEDIEACGSASEDQEEEMVRLKAIIEDEEGKRIRWKAENIRRKHNYIPLIINMLKILANEGQLMPLYKSAVEKSKIRLAREQSKGKRKL